MQIKWMLTHKVSPHAQPAPDFTACDGGEAIGRVYQIEDGPDRGLWLWAMTASQTGVPFDHQTRGRAAERGKAGRCVIEAYQALTKQRT
jgi:hypothetical protein